jgi:hypothetical protein
MLSYFFYIAYISAMRFAQLRPNLWLEVLITCSLSVEIFSMFRQAVQWPVWGTTSHYCTGGVPQ